MQKANITAGAMVAYGSGVVAAFLFPSIYASMLALYCGVFLCIAFAVVYEPARIASIWIVAFCAGVIRFEQGSIPLHFLDSIIVPLGHVTNLFIENIQRALPEPHAGYLAGILVGVRSTMPRDLKQAFINTGTMHVTALSGYNVTIIAEYLMLVFRSVGVSIGGIVLFVLMTGASSSVVRAAIMGVLVALARMSGKEYSAARALLGAVFVMLFFTPHILFDDISFQLSVAATAGIIFLPRYIDLHLKHFPQRFGIRESLSVTLSAQIATLPIVTYYFHTFSFISPIVNILVLPTVPITMLLGFLVGVIGFTSDMLAHIIAWPTYLVLNYQLYVIQFFSQLVM